MNTIGSHLVKMQKKFGISHEGTIDMKDSKQDILTTQ